jgi:WD40 repeat protein
LSGAVAGDWPISGSEVAAFTPDLRAIYYSVSVAVAGGELDLWRTDLGTGTARQVYEAHVPYPHCVAFTPNGHILAIGGSHYAGDGRDSVHRLDVWHMAELEPIPTRSECLAYSPDGRLLATGCPVTGVRVYAGKTLVQDWSEPAATLAWSANDQLGWAALERCAVARPGVSEAVLAFEGPAEGALRALAFSPDWSLLLAGTERGQCVIHDPTTGERRKVFDWGIGPIHSVCFSPDGLTCAAGGENGRVVVWDVDL